MSDNLRVRREPWPFTFSVDALAPWQTYAVAIGATTAILGVRLRLGGSFEGQSALAMFTIPIMLSAFLGGLGPGLLATALSSVLAAYYLSPPIHSLAIASVTGRWQLFFVALAGVFITTLNEGLHRARRRAESATLAHQHAEAEVRASEQKLRQVIDGLGPEVFLGLMTPDGILVEANRPGLQAAGVRADEVLGKQFDQTYWWGHSEAAREQLRATMVRAAAGEPSRYDVQVRVSGDALVWVDFSVNPVLDADGRVIYLVPSAAVIDDRIRAEEALFQAGALQRAIFNSANFSSIATDAEGVIQIFNVGAERMLGYAAAEVVNTITPTWIFDPQEVVARATALSLVCTTLGRTAARVNAAGPPSAGDCGPTWLSITRPRTDSHQRSGRRWRARAR